LVGDAAHTIHPLAGLGVNLGFKDAAKLAEVLNGVAKHQLGRFKVLRRYERARRGDNVLTMKAMEAFSLVFKHRAEPVKTLRNTGLNWINQTHIIKRLLIQLATGK
jgi:2-octaprenylphenol hydroxylase